MTGIWITADKADLDVAAGMVPIGVVLQELIGHDLRDHPGRGSHLLAVGAERAGDLLQERIRTEYERGAALCESPIERNMLAVLLTAQWPTVAAGYVPTVWNSGDDPQPIFDGGVIIVPQKRLGPYRVDFLATVACGAAPTVVAIECDGRDFHRDIARERERDAFLNGVGVWVYHVSGSDLTRRPFGVANALMRELREVCCQ